MIGERAGERVCAVRGAPRLGRHVVGLARARPARPAARSRSSCCTSTPTDSPEAVARFEREARLLAGLAQPERRAAARPRASSRAGRSWCSSWSTAPTCASASAGGRRCRSPRRVAIARRRSRTASRPLTRAARPPRPEAGERPDRRRRRACCVADFGIARALEEPGLTQPGRVLGTGEYVVAGAGARPQASTHGPTSTRSACVLYEMLARAGRRSAAPASPTSPRATCATSRRRSPRLARTGPGRARRAGRCPAREAARRPARRRPRTCATGCGRSCSRSRRHRARWSRPRYASIRTTPSRAAGEYAGSTTGRRASGELAPWEDVTPSSMDFPLAPRPVEAPIEPAPYRRAAPAHARTPAPLRWVAVGALGVAVGARAAAALTGGDSPTTTAAATAAPSRRRRADDQRDARHRHTAGATDRAAPGEAQTTLAIFDPPPRGTTPRTTTRRSKAVDGDAPTFWETETYRNDPDLADGRRAASALIASVPHRAPISAVEVHHAGAGLHRRGLHVERARHRRRRWTGWKQAVEVHRSCGTRPRSASR